GMLVVAEAAAVVRNPDAHAPLVEAAGALAGEPAQQRIVAVHEVALVVDDLQRVVEEDSGGDLEGRDEGDRDCRREQEAREDASGGGHSSNSLSSLRGTLVQRS